jgi:hypothetical protein
MKQKTLWLMILWSYYYFPLYREFYRLPAILPAATAAVVRDAGTSHVASVIPCAYRYLHGSPV